MKSDPSSILTLINDPWGHFYRVIFFIFQRPNPNLIVLNGLNTYRLFSLY